MPDKKTDLPDRLSLDPRSPHFNQDILEQGVGIRFNGKEKTNVEEYCVSEGWIKVAAGRSLDRYGRPIYYRYAPREAYRSGPPYGNAYGHYKNKHKGVKCDKRGRCETRYYDPRYDRSYNARYDNRYYDNRYGYRDDDRYWDGRRWRDRD